jgi:tetratricopeptide (TPR) repeat protein
MNDSMKSWMRFSFTGLLLACLALAGCAKGPGSAKAAREGRAGAVIRPDAPPEYDLLVAQEFEQRGQLSDALAAYERAVAKDPDSAYLERKLAESMVRQNRLADGLEHAERAHDLDPDDASTRIFLGRLYRLRRSPADAERVLLGESDEPLDDDSGYLLYEIYLDARRPDDARRIAEWLVERDPASTRTRLALANVYDLLGRPSDAERVLREALDEDPDNLSLYVALARSRRERGDRDGEIAVYREILDRSPNHHAALVSLADAQLKSEDLEGAMNTLEQIEEHHPADQRSSVRLAFLLYEARRYAEATERFERVVAKNPEEYEIVFFLGIAQRRSGDSDGSVATFERIPVEDDHYPEARTQIAALYERREKYAEALAEVEKAAAAKPSQELELYAATLRSKAGDFDGAVAHLEGLLSDQPDDDELLYNLGVVYGEADRIDEAIAYMRRALDENPDNASALNYIGYTWAERGINLDEAESMIARAIELRPEDGYIADSLGWVYYMRARPLVEDGRLPEAREFIDRALEELERADDLTGGDPVVSEHIGDIYLLLDDKQRALDKFEEALRLEPRFGEQPDLLQKLETLRRELQ